MNLAQLSTQAPESVDTFREETKAWLERHCPPSQRRPVRQEEQVWGGRKRRFPSEDARLWFESMVARGWTVPDWPSCYGGGGLDPQRAQILQQEMKKLKCRAPLLDQGIWMLGPALLEFGSEAVKMEHLPKIARGELRWCQGYSEPGAGSDLASLQCKAESHGDEFVINGTKLWTTFADQSDWIYCLVRTGQTEDPRQGISFLLIDLSSIGVSINSVPLISGVSEFCQVFFDNVRVPRANLVGELHGGWPIAKFLLKHERRYMAAMGSGDRASNMTAAQAARVYAPKSGGKLSDQSLRERLVEHDMQFRALALTHFRGSEERSAGQANATLPLIMKYLGTEEEKRRTELLVAILGCRGLGWEGDAFSDEELLVASGMLFSKALSIAGGTSEIQLNQIAKRVLGLPD